ncbi:MAG: hypothetical protein L0H70_09195, partial [Xanthomonadales bacterium]|nr:hypothetical protein [Xanthomonadales bacterium]
SDYTGSGRSSFVVLRKTGGGPNGAVTWFVKDNDGGKTGSASSFVLGDASDSLVDGDFDGDGIADAAACDLPTGACSIRRSSRPGTPWVVPFGQAGDNVTQVGDYDGDGIDDLAAYRAGASTGQVSHTVVRLTRSGAVRDLVTGEYGAFAHGGIDYTGDSMADMAIQSDAGGGVAAFRIYDGTTGTMVSTFTFGTPSDIMVLGNHGGSEWGDITVTPSVSGNVNWTTRDGQTGVGQPSVMHGVTSDYRLSGDFDGDGLDDYAVWRPSATASQSKFVVRLSSAPSPLLEVNFGQLDDYPIENSRVH